MDEQVTIGLERYNNLIGQCAKLQSLKDKGFAVNVNLWGSESITIMIDEKAELKDLYRKLESMSKHCGELGNIICDFRFMSVAEFRKSKKNGHKSVLK